MQRLADFTVHHVEGRAWAGAARGAHLARFDRRRGPSPWRIEIEPSHVRHLGGSVLAARDLEYLDFVQLERKRRSQVTALRDCVR